MKTSFKTGLVILLALLGFQKAKAEDYVCFLLLNEEIKNTMEEHERQKNLRNQEGILLGAEIANKKQWTDFQERTAKIRKRLNTVSSIISGAQSAYNISRSVAQIYEIQEQIIKELSDAPLFVVTALPGQIEFGKHVTNNLALIAGIILSYGDLMQMESKDRKMLLSFAEEEFYALQGEAMAILQNILTAKQSLYLKKGMLRGWIDRDKQIFEEIIYNAKNL